MRLVRGALSLVALAVLCGGAPLLLVAFGSLDFAALARPFAPDDGSLLTSFVTVAGWIAWLAMVVEIATDLAAGLSGGRFRWRPVTGGWIRPVTSVLVAAVVAMSMTRASTPELVGPPPAAITATSTVGTTEASGFTEAELTEVHVVGPGEDLWGISAQVLGDGSHWRRLADLNPQLAGGLVTPGMEITVPSMATVAPPDPGPSTSEGDRRVTVAPGDSLWTLAQKWLGDGDRWTEIAAANATLVSNPHQIEIGWVLRIPAPMPTQVTQLVDETSQPSPRSVTEAMPESVESRTSSEGSPPTPEDHHQHDADEASERDIITDDPARLVAGGITAALAAGIGAGLVIRRRQQLAARALGMRVPHPGSESVRFATALGRLASHAQPMAPTPTSVLVGEDAAGGSVLVDVGAVRVTSVAAESSVATNLIGGMVTSLVCADWSSDVLVTVVSEPLAWTSAFDHPNLTITATPEQAVLQWERTAAQRHGQTDDGDDSPPEVYLFCEELAPATLRNLATTGHPKMHAVVAQPTSLAGETLTVSQDRGTVESTGVEFIPQLLGEPARRALVELHEATSSEAVHAAPWWYHPPKGVEPPTPLVIRDRPTLPHDDEGATVHHTPRLLLLGPIQLVGTQGPLPPRAVKQCIEYCAWIHEFPGRSSTQMVGSLLVAESTRRSNMSRLRTWLGNSPEGDPYLPEAYTGRITLHPDVTSDWELLQLKLTGGVNRAPGQALVDALTLVRGAPLADAAPGQWHWAEEMRSDMISTIRDAAVVLGRRALEIADLDTVRWAAHRALQVAPDDELLMGLKIKAEHISGNRPEVERMVLQVTRHARLMGSDLQEQTILLLQEVMEGRPRSQRA